MAQIADLSIIFGVLEGRVPLWNDISDMITGSSYTQTLAKANKYIRYLYIYYIYIFPGIFLMLSCFQKLFFF